MHFRIMKLKDGQVWHLTQFYYVGFSLKKNKAKRFANQQRSNVINALAFAAKCLKPEEATLVSC